MALQAGDSDESEDPYTFSDRFGNSERSGRYANLENTIGERHVAKSTCTGALSGICIDQNPRRNGRVNFLINDPNRAINQPIGLDMRDLIEKQR